MTFNRLRTEKGWEAEEGCDYSGLKIKTLLKEVCVGISYMRAAKTKREVKKETFRKERSVEYEKYSKMKIDVKG